MQRLFDHHPFQHTCRRDRRHEGQEVLAPAPGALTGGHPDRPVDHVGIKLAPGERVEHRRRQRPLRDTGHDRRCINQAERGGIGIGATRSW